MSQNNNDRQTGNRNSGNKKPSGAFSGMGFAIVGLLIFLVASSFFKTDSTANSQLFKYSEILKYFDEGKVDEYSLDLGTGKLILYLKDGEVFEEIEEQKKKEQEQREKSILASFYKRMEASEAKAEQERRAKLIAEGKEDEIDDRASTAYMVPNGSIFIDNIDKAMREYNEANPDNRITYEYIRAKQPSVFMDMLPTILIMGLVLGGTYLIMRNSLSSGGKMGGSFAKKKEVADGSTVKTRFSDVAGADEEKEALVEIVEFLKEPHKYNKLGAKIPKGVLLVGPPGTGKTLLARATAGEANVPFFSVAGSDFVEMIVGMGASRVRELFSEARKVAPAIIFIDEIDAVGQERGTGGTSANDEREQTLNQILVEMDGFEEDTGVIVIAATNRSDLLDKALLRPGRFDRQIQVGYPDVNGRFEILKIHTKDKPLAPDVNLMDMARIAIGFTGADLENLANEAALLAAKRGKQAITMAEFQESLMTVAVGFEKKSKVVSEEDKRLTCYHESGHAIATYFSKTQDPVHEISIVPRGLAGGYTMSLPEKDTMYVKKTEMMERIVVTLGGRIAEEIVLDDVSTGASGDFKSATTLAKDMITKYGFSEKLGPIVYGKANLGEHGLTFDSSYSEKTAQMIDDEIRSLIDNAYNICKVILTENVEKLHKVSKYLYLNEKIPGTKFIELMEGEEDYDEVIILEDGTFRLREEAEKEANLTEAETPKEDDILEVDSDEV